MTAKVTTPPAPEPYELLRDVVTITLLHGAACLIARGMGFDHVSDDDFARVTIAQTFAHSPKLDPSGTSWLPFPFWILGGIMAITGRSLAMARWLSIGIAALAASSPYLAMRYAGVVRPRALFATALAFGTPWAVWLGAATVPESLTASLTATAAIGLSAVITRQRDSERSDDESPPSSIEKVKATFGKRAWLWFGLAMLAACLSRYESWPVAAVLAVALTVRAAGSGSEPRARNEKERSVRSGSTLSTQAKRACIVAAILCVLGPIAWMAWNAHAHDGPFHFFRRVANFKRAIGEGSTDTLESVLMYPRLLFTSRPEVAIPLLLLLPSLRKDHAVRDRWGIPLLAAVAQLVFLAYGNVRDGAAAHHPERALFSTYVIFALFVADVGLGDLLALAKSGKVRLAQIIAAAVLAGWTTWIVRNAEVPGRTPSEDRNAQITRGEKLRADGVAAIAVTPCGFEHFALLAAYGSPERASVAPRTGITPTAECPRVEQ